ncbi:Hypothetical_protein [Hexamita inflata]|uniref:Hypothetical_protein n=1 Tax=Hexamita inflata TaxID=28002 RepID=A0AA86PVT7_9EUKA|nr:Hypothetical protein HINF_LOCUS33416 [Hexamita inflata]
MKIYSIINNVSVGVQYEKHSAAWNRLYRLQKAFQNIVKPLLFTIHLRFLTYQIKIVWVIHSNSMLIKYFGDTFSSAATSEVGLQNNIHLNTYRPDQTFPTAHGIFQLPPICVKIETSHHSLFVHYVLIQSSSILDQRRLSEPLDYFFCDHLVHVPFVLAFLSSFDELYQPAHLLVDRVLLLGFFLDFLDLVLNLFELEHELVSARVGRFVQVPEEDQVSQFRRDAGLQQFLIILCFSSNLCFSRLSWSSSCLVQEFCLADSVLCVLVLVWFWLFSWAQILCTCLNCSLIFSLRILSSLFFMASVSCISFTLVSSSSTFLVRASSARILLTSLSFCA